VGTSGPCGLPSVGLPRRLHRPWHELWHIPSLAQSLLHTAPYSIALFTLILLAPLVNVLGTKSKDGGFESVDIFTVYVMIEALQNVIPLNSRRDSGARTTLGSFLPFLGLDAEALTLDPAALTGDLRRWIFEGGEGAATGILRFGAIGKGSGQGSRCVSLRDRVLPLFSSSFLDLIGEWEWLMGDREVDCWLLLGFSDVCWRFPFLWQFLRNSAIGLSKSPPPVSFSTIASIEYAWRKSSYRLKEWMGLYCGRILFFWMDLVHPYLRRKVQTRETLACFFIMWFG